MLFSAITINLYRYFQNLPKYPIIPGKKQFLRKNSNKTHCRELECTIKINVYLQVYIQELKMCELTDKCEMYFFRGSCI